MTPTPPGPRSSPSLTGSLPAIYNPTGYLENLVQTYGDVVFLEIRGEPLYLLNHPDFVSQVEIPGMVVPGQVLDLPFWRPGSYEGHLSPDAMGFDGALCARKSQEIVTAACVDWCEGQTISLKSFALHLALRLSANCLLHVNDEDWLNQMQMVLQALERGQRGLLAVLPVSLTFGHPQRMATVQARMQRLIHTVGACVESPQVFVDVVAALTGVIGWGLALLSANLALQTHVGQALQLWQQPEPAQVMLHRIVCETLRLYPPAWLSAHRLAQDVQLGGYCLPGGSRVMFSAWTLQRDPRFYQEPGRFDPSRWEASQQVVRPWGSYRPFGQKPGGWVFEEFVRTAAEAALSVVIGQWRVALNTPGWGKPAAARSLLPRANVTLQLVGRNCD